MDKLFVIFNPAARGEKTQRVRKFLEAKAGHSVTLAPTQRAGDAKLLAARAVQEGYPIIVAAGGDGTINRKSSMVLALTGATLGVLPLGTVNVFAQELRIPRRIDAAWHIIQAGTTRTIDLARAEAGASHALLRTTGCGVGFDAQAVRDARDWEVKEEDRAAQLCVGGN